MAYFNHAFHKVLLGTDGFTDLDLGKLGTSGVGFNNVLSTGQFCAVNPKTWDIYATNTVFETCCPIIIAAGSLYQHDKIGPFHGGYKESNKTKMINPKYVHRFYRVDPCTPQNMQITVGANQNNWEGGECNANSGTTINKTFYCGETYYLRVDIKGSPVLRTLSRNTYYTADAYTGCCPDDAIAPVAVNPLVVYAKWAYNLLNSPLISPFINIQITYNVLGDGVLWEQLAPSTATSGSAGINGYTFAAGAGTDMATLLQYVNGTLALPGDENTLAGLIITGAYVDTRFGNCTFYPNDAVIPYVEPVKIYASEVDYTGDPCTFQGLCVFDACQAVQGSGFGETVVRDLIQSEMYLQNYFYTGMDLRIREITQGYDVTDAIDRMSSYTRYYIQHSVPRFNNPTGTFDNDQYLIEIITDGTLDGPGSFEAFFGGLLEACGDGCAALEEYLCPEGCEYVPATTPVIPA
jgi:hypothetical protein